MTVQFWPNGIALKQDSDVDKALGTGISQRIGRCMKFLANLSCYIAKLSLFESPDWSNECLVLLSFLHWSFITDNLKMSENLGNMKVVTYMFHSVRHRRQEELVHRALTSASRFVPLPDFSGICRHSLSIDVHPRKDASRDVTNYSLYALNFDTLNPSRFIENFLF